MARSSASAVLRGVLNTPLLLLLITQADPRIPAPPVFRHHANPESRTVTTVYECDGGERRFSVRYIRFDSEIEFVGGTRNGAALPASEVERATRALRQLDSVTTLIPQCSPESDSIMALGLIGQQRAIVFLIWTDDRLQASPPQFVN